MLPKRIPKPAKPDKRYRSPSHCAFVRSHACCRCGKMENIDMPSGNVMATVRMGSDEATAEAKYLNDAVTLARGIILRKREADAKKKKEKAQ